LENKFFFLKSINFKYKSKCCDIYAKTFNKENFRELELGFKLNKNIEELVFNNNNIGENKEILEDNLTSLLHCKNLNEISFYRENITFNKGNIKLICNTLKKLEKFSWIWFDGNILGNNKDDINELCFFKIDNNNNIERLSLFDNSLGLNSEENLKNLFNAINLNKKLKYLNIKNNGFNSSNINFELLVKLNFLKEVNLISNNFNKEAKEKFKIINIKYKINTINYNNNNNYEVLKIF
jgi:hypothetical protein